MKPIGSIHIPDSACLSKVLRYLDKEISHLQEVFNKEPVITDGDTDVTQRVKGRLDGYREIKFFIEREC